MKAGMDLTAAVLEQELGLMMNPGMEEAEASQLILKLLHQIQPQIGVQVQEKTLNGILQHQMGWIILWILNYGKIILIILRLNLIL